MKDKISKILEKEIWISEDYDARKDKSQYFIEGIYSATDELLTLFNSEIAKRDELINKSLKLIGEIIDNYEADAINLPCEFYNDLKFHWKQINKLKAEIK